MIWNTATHLPDALPGVSLKRVFRDPETMSISVFSVLRRFLEEYSSGTPSKIKVIDAYLLYMVLTGAFAFLYCLLVGTFPFNSFLSGFISCVASFTLAGKFPESLVN